MTEKIKLPYPHVRNELQRIANDHYANGFDDGFRAAKRAAAECVDNWTGIDGTTIQGSIKAIRIPKVQQ